jgi:hypothetical protein
MPRAGSSFTASTDRVSTRPVETTYEDQPLTCLLLSQDQCWGGALWRLSMKLVPSHFKHGISTLYSGTDVHWVQSLYINHYVCSNKLVLS